MNGGNFEGIFRQAMFAKQVSKNENNENNPDVCINCKVMGMIDDIQGLRICTACGFENPGLVQVEQNMYNENGRRNNRLIAVRNKNNKIHVQLYAKKIYSFLFPHKNDIDQNILGEVMKNVQELSERRKGKKLSGMNLYVIIGIFMECAFMKRKTPIIRQKIIEYISKATLSDPRRKILDLQDAHATYNSYLNKKQYVDLQVIVQGCRTKPTVKDLTKYIVNDLGFSDKARNEVHEFVKLLSPVNNNVNNTRPEVIARRTNNEIAAFIVFVVAYHQNTFPSNAPKAKTVYGVSKTVLLNMYDALLNSNMKLPFKLKAKKDLFKTPSPKKQNIPSPKKQKTPSPKMSPQKNVKDFKVYVGDRHRKCMTFSKTELMGEVTARKIANGNKKMSKESLCALLMRHQLAGPQR